ncbi:MAG: hypothetical protein HFJ53_05930 [Clostridia bacterium]|jgi:ribosome maturation factor RimP|nr:hypothetical protein [Clostridia bacterium]
MIIYGKEVEVSLYKPLEKQKQITGVLKAIDNETIQIQVEKGINKIERKNIARVKTIYNWKEE